MSTAKGRLNINTSSILAADAKVKAMVEDYVHWASDDVHKLLRECGRLREAGNVTAVETEKLFLLLHNLKGQGGTFDFHLMTAIATIACDIVRDRTTVTPDALVALERCAHAMRTVLSRRITGKGGANGPTMIGKILEVAGPYMNRAD
jgi:hypothetical protein